MNRSLAARPAVRELRSSKIREVANVGMGRKDVLPFWFGEPDEVTPEFIRRAWIAALRAGVGSAPGAAVGPEGEGFIRWCFATEVSLLEQGLERFSSGLARVRAAG